MPNELIPLAIAFAFVFLPTREDMRDLILRLAAGGWSHSAQWALAFGLSFLPVFILLLPFSGWYRRAKNAYKAWLLTALILLNAYCIIRVFWWISA